MELNVIDIVSIVIIVIAAIRCTFRGFIAEAFSMAAIIVGGLAAVFFSKAGALLIESYFGYSVWNQIIAFLVIFLVVYLVVKLLQGIILRILEKIHLQRLDKALGLFLGIVEGLFVVVIIVYVLEVQPLFDVETLLSESFLARTIIDLVPIVTPETAPVLQNTNV